MTTEQEKVKALFDEIKANVDKGLEVSESKYKELGEGMQKLSDQIEALQKKYNVSVPGVDEGKEKFSFAKCMKHIADGGTMKTIGGYEGEVIVATQKAQTITPVTAGGVIVPTEVSQRIVEKAEAMTVLNSLPIQQVAMSGSNKLSIPTITSNPSAAWFAELADVTESSMVFGSVPVEPHKVAAYVVASNELLAQENYDMENLILNQMAQQLALAFDDAGLQGDGTNKPLGILNTVGINTVTPGANGDPASWATMSELEELLEDENTFEGSLAFISNPGVFRRLREQTVAQFSGQAAEDGQPLMNPYMSQAQLESQVGYPLKSTTQLAKSTVGLNLCAALIHGDFSQYIWARYGTLELASDTSSKFQQYGTAMRAVARGDMRVLRPKSFAVNPSVAIKAA